MNLFLTCSYVNTEVVLDRHSALNYTVSYQQLRLIYSDKILQRKKSEKLAISVHLIINCLVFNYSSRHRDVPFNQSHL